MQSKTNRMISVAMSAALMLTNMISPMKIFAEEVSEPMTDAYIDEVTDDTPEQLPETEPPNFSITLPWYEDVGYMVDEGRVWRPENASPEDKDIIIRYQSGEKVEFAFTPYENVTVTELHLRNAGKEEQYFETDEYGKVSFLMPEEDLYFSLVSAPIPVPVTEAQVVDQPETTPDDPETNEEAEPDYTEPDYAQENNEDAAWTDVPEEDMTGSNAAVEDPAQPSDDPNIALTAETADDGLPSQGSIMTVETLMLPLGASDFSPEADFSNITFDEALETVELVSNEVDVNTPGTYSTIYRVNHEGGRMWYVLRPVTVMEQGQMREGETTGLDQAQAGEGTDNEESDEGDDEETEAQLTEEMILETQMPEEESELSFQMEEVSPAETEAISEENDENPEETQEETTEAISEADTEETTEEPLEDLEEESETETEGEGKYKVTITRGEDLGISLDHKDGTYNEGETVTFTTDLPAGTLTAVAALKEESNRKIDTADILYSEVTNVGNSTFSFEMPAEDIELEVAKDNAFGAMLLAAAPSDEWDDNTEVDAGSYYYFSDGTLHPFNSVMGSGGNDSYKYVRYKVDDKTYTVYAYCMQHSMSSPPSGTTYSSLVSFCMFIYLLVESILHAKTMPIFFLRNSLFIRFPLKYRHSFFIGISRIMPISA